MRPATHPSADRPGRERPADPSAETVFRSLGGSRTARGFLCRCPVPSHGQGRGDRNPSLFVTDGARRLMTTCFAGCSWQDIRAALESRDTTAFPNLATALWRTLLVDAGIQRAWLVGLGRCSAHERTAHLVCELYLRLAAIGLAADHRYRLPLTQTSLADTLGLTSVHVNRTFTAMREQNLLTLRGGVLTIHDWNGLVEAGGFDPGYLHLPR